MFLFHESQQAPGQPFGEHVFCSKTRSQAHVQDNQHNCGVHGIVPPDPCCHREPPRLTELPNGVSTLRSDNQSCPLSIILRLSGEHRANARGRAEARHPSSVASPSEIRGIRHRR